MGVGNVSELTTSGNRLVDAGESEPLEGDDKDFKPPALALDGRGRGVMAKDFGRSAAENPSTT